MSGTRGGGFHLADMDARHMERLHAEPMRVFCAFCSWSAEGIAGDLLKRSQRHRERRHGIERVSRRKFRHIGNLSYRQPNLTVDDMADIEREVAKRKRLLGIAA